MRHGFVVAHSGRQHSHQMAMGLHQQNLLHQYWTGLPISRQRGFGRWMEWLRVRSAYPEVELPPRKVRVQLLTPLLQKFGAAIWADRAGDALYARWLGHVSQELAGVVVYENAALNMIRAARQRGLRVVLDAASVHHVTADAWLKSKSNSESGIHVRRRKQAEAMGADCLLVLSDLAAESYRRGGIAPEKITVIRPGYDPAIFRPGPGPSAATEATFVFAGHHAYLKGLDLLLDALTQLAIEGVKFRLLVVGVRPPQVSSVLQPRLTECGKLTQAEFARQLAQAHCLVLPSRCDSFGLVGLESLAVGTPVLVSDRAGVHELIEEGVNGWCVPADDVDALAARLRECCCNPDAMLRMRAAAIASARPWTWARYRVRVADVLRQSA